MKQTFLFCLLLGFSLPSFCQKDKKIDPWTTTTLEVPVPINRQLSHDKIDRLQKEADAFDGTEDGIITVKNKSEASEVITAAIIKRIDQLQIIIENLPLDHFKKIATLKFLEAEVKEFVKDEKEGKAEPEYYKNLVNNFEVFFKKLENNESIVEYINSNFNRAMFANINMFKNDQPAIEAIYKNLVRLYPKEMRPRLNEYSDYEAAEDLMAWLAKQQPSLILTYATSTSMERYIVRRCKDTLVMKIVEIADKTKTPLRAISFLDDLLDGSKTIVQVNMITSDNALYYKSLIEQRMKPNALSKKIIERESKLQALEYVRTMNELHEATDPIRFACIEPLTAKEIYFLMVLCSDEIYTSTFVGSFNRMLLKMAPEKGDIFLTNLHSDKFRTFIRMCAGYNKLDEFLATVEDKNRNVLMASFVHHIDDNVETDVEDAVDVADAMGSIADPTLQDYLLAELKKDYERTYKEDKKRGLIIYFLLHTLGTSIINPDDANEELQRELKVPPITFVRNSSLLDSTGQVIEQVFFYGDDDGRDAYAGFMSAYKPEAWKIDKNDKWVSLTSIVGKPMTIYANLPLDEPNDEDAQNVLVKYLQDKQIRPSVIVHRGHSYHLPTTLKFITPYTKIIVLGSCGGYHNLSTILGLSEDAHIISSKQTGTRLINEPIINRINDKLIAGKDINWIELWKDLGGLMTTPALQDKFNDYVPPHKNMGALFLKAFKIQMIENGLQ